MGVPVVFESRTLRLATACILFAAHCLRAHMLFEEKEEENTKFKNNKQRTNTHRKAKGSRQVYLEWEGKGV